MTSRRLALSFAATAVFVVAMLLVACDDNTPAADTPTAAVGASSTAVATGTGSVASPTAPTSLPQLALVPVVDGFQRPTYVTDAGDGSGRLFVVEKGGTIRIVTDGVTDPQPFLDVTAAVTSRGNEQGLLGLAFHPKFRENGRFFITYTAASGGANTLAEYTIDRQTGRGDPNSGKVLISIPDQFSNHNGGMVAFGPDGYLYFSTGDGGSQGDPEGNGQDLGTLLAKILRLDVDGATPFAIPASNPFVATPEARPEIWAYGLRNPWRFSFDRATGDVWIADVGQNRWEEVNRQPAASKGGENYGWSVLEGESCYKPGSGCDRAGKVPPVHVYSHDNGCSVTGGYVYRGKAIPAAVGRYFFIDYCAGRLTALRPGQGGEYLAEDVLDTDAGISSFGEDAQGELYLVGDGDGVLYRLAAK